jgi:hypothetical protein
MFPASFPVLNQKPLNRTGIRGFTHLNVPEAVRILNTKAYIASLTKDQKMLIYCGLKKFYKLKELLDWT